MNMVRLFISTNTDRRPPLRTRRGLSSDLLVGTVLVREPGLLLGANGFDPGLCDLLDRNLVQVSKSVLQL